MFDSFAKAGTQAQQVLSEGWQVRDMQPYPDPAGWTRELPACLLQAGSSVALPGLTAKDKLALLDWLAQLATPGCDKFYMAWQGPLVPAQDGVAPIRVPSAFIFHPFQLLPHLCVLENVMQPLEARGVRGAQDKAEEILERVGLSQQMYHYPKYLSALEQFKAALARVFVARPACVVADEPLAGLDAEHRNQASELLFALNREQGAALLLLSADAELSARCAYRLQPGMEIGMGSVQPCI